MPLASSRSRPVRTVLSDSPVYRTSVATDQNAPGPSGPGVVAQADEYELSRGGRLPAPTDQDRGQVQRPGDRHDAHRAPLPTRAAPRRAARPSISVSVSFTPVRDRSPMFTQIVFAQFADGGGRQ